MIECHFARRGSNRYMRGGPRVHSFSGDSLVHAEDAKGAPPDAVIRS
jgi:hypothetical protein